MRADPRIALGAGLLALALVPSVAGWLEASLVRHLLGHYPLLVGGGALIGGAMARPDRATWTAAPALLMGVLALAFWLLPRWIDAALVDPAINAAKAASLVLLAGLPLGWGWRLAGPVPRSFLCANAAAMLAVMGWLQLAMPVRLCNGYLLADQRDLGRWLLLLAALTLAAGLGRVLVGGMARPRGQKSATARDILLKRPRIVSLQAANAAALDLHGPGRPGTLS